jgi:hypothetical protein
MKSIHALEKVALEMPECSIWHYAIPPEVAYSPATNDSFQAYLSTFPIGISKERVHKMISKSGQTLGEYDFFFEWHEDPTWEQLKTLIEKIDTVLKDTGCLYRIVTK